MDEMQGRLAAYYTQTFPDRPGVEISGLTCLNAGWESDVYAFDVRYGPADARQEEALILRLYPGEHAVYKATHEFKGMTKLYQARYPVPRVLLLETEQAPLGRPFIIMERIQGEVMWLLLRIPERQHELLELFCRLFVQLHTLDWRPFVTDPTQYDSGDPLAPLRRYLARMRRYATEFGQPGYEPVLAWLEARLSQAPCPQPTPLHWDFHPGNILVREDGSAVVIDWTQIDISEPRLDLAWTLLLVGAYAGPEWRERILREYERQRGAPVEQIEYFDVAACCRRLLSITVSVSAGAERLGMRPGAEEIMKQQNEATARVYELLKERTGVRVAEVEDLLAIS